jgi:glycosyltransferase involved in cell wall biosynthesis
VKISVCTVAYNEAEWIETCVLQFQPFIDRHLVLVSSKPWFGSAGPDDGTADIARDAGAEVHVQHWNTESEQRNWGLARLFDDNYVLIVDADELYARSGISHMLNWLERAREPAFRAAEMLTYWKTIDYVCDPSQGWDAPVIAVDPKRAKFRMQRQLQPLTEKRPLPPAVLPVTLHHMSWVKSDAKVREKIQSFSHAEHIRDGWYENVWLKWTPEMEDIAPYSFDAMRAVYRPCPSLDC